MTFNNIAFLFFYISWVLRNCPQGKLRPNSKTNPNPKPNTNPKHSGGGGGGGAIVRILFHIVKKANQMFFHIAFFSILLMSYNFVFLNNIKKWLKILIIIILRIFYI